MAAKDLGPNEDVQTKFEDLRYHYDAMSAITAGDQAKLKEKSKARILQKARRREQDGIPHSAKHLRPVKVASEVIGGNGEVADAEIVRYEINSDYNSSDEDQDDFGPDDEEMEDAAEEDGLDHDRHFSEVEDDDEEEAAPHSVKLLEDAGGRVGGGDDVSAAPAGLLPQPDDAVVEEEGDEDGSQADEDGDDAASDVGTTDYEKMQREVDMQIAETQVMPDSLETAVTAVENPEAGHTPPAATTRPPTVQEPAATPVLRRPTRLAMGNVVTSQDYRERVMREYYDSRPDAQLMQEFEQAQRRQPPPQPSASAAEQDVERSDQQDTDEQDADMQDADMQDTAEQDAAEQDAPEQDAAEETISDHETPVEAVPTLSQLRKVETLSEVDVVSEDGVESEATKKTKRGGRKKAKVATSSEQSLTSSQRDREMMPPPSFKPPKRPARRESDGSEASFASTSSHMSASTNATNREARKSAKRRKAAKARRASGEQSASVTSSEEAERRRTTHGEVGSHATPNGETPTRQSGQSPFPISQEFEEFRHKQFEFPTPKPAAQGRNGVVGLPYAPSDTDEESVRSTMSMVE